MLTVGSHSFWPYIEGVSERTHTDAELEAMKPENRPKIKFEGREYDDYQATQKQRQIDRLDRYGDSDFLRSVEGKDPMEAWRIVDDLMDTLRVVNPRVYDGVMRKLSQL